MEEEQKYALILAAQAFRFATNHPYAATGLLGAAVGSAVTYQVMTHPRASVHKVFTPKVYEFALTPEDLQRMLVDPTVEVRYETPEIAVVVTPEQREKLKALPDIEQ